MSQRTFTVEVLGPWRHNLERQFYVRVHDLEKNGKGRQFCHLKESECEAFIRVLREAAKQPRREPD